MESIKKKVVLSKDAANLIIAKTVDESEYVSKVYCLRDGKLDNKFERFMKTEIEGNEIKANIVVSLKDEKSLAFTDEIVDHSRERIKHILGLDLVEMNLEIL